jgi:phosphate transport system substrate-binding protein
MTHFRRFSAAFGVAGVLALVAPVGALASSLITLSGSTASYPLVALLAAKYARLQHGQVRFRITQGGTTVGINDVAAGRVNIADVSRDPLASDPAGLDFYPIAKYALCVVTNSSNHLGNLTTAQTQAIFTGKIHSWSEVPGAGASGNIDVIGRTSTAGTLTNFQTLLLEGKKVTSSATQEASEGLQRQAIKNDPNAIGWLSNYQAITLGGVNVVSYNGVACNVANARTGSYAGVARFYEVTKGRAQGNSKAFISWIDHSRAANRIISSQWLPL